ncbi:MAG: hypothetical protein ACKO14_09445 [Armatimonadota bacterium]
MKPLAIALAGGTAFVAAVAGWELRSQWLASTLRILPTSGHSQITGNE